MLKSISICFASILCIASNIAVPSAKANSWKDYGYLKGCGELVSMHKHGTPRYRSVYMKSEFCKKRLADHKANNPDW